jgi:predicted RNA-binding protein with RPS1 domain
MTIHNRRYKKQILREASLLLEYNRLKVRTRPRDKALWECIENMYSEIPLTEERLQEQTAIINWISKLGENALGAIKKYVSGADEETKKMAKDLANEADQEPIGSEIKSLLKKGNWKDAFTKASTWINGKSGGNLQEISLQSIGDWWRNNPVKRVILTLSFLVLMFVQASPGEKITQDDVDTTGQTEYVLDGEPVDDINSYDDIFADNTETPNELKFGGQSIESAGFETGVSFELGSSNLDTQGLQQIDDIASDYLNQIEAALANGDSIQSLDIEVQGGASNTGDGWDNDNSFDGSLTENRASEGANKLNDSLKKQAQQRGIDLSGIDISFDAQGMDDSDLGGNENVKDGQKTSTQNTLFNGVLTHTPPAQDAPDTGVDLGMQDYDMAKFGGEPQPKIDDDFKPGTSRGSRNLEYRDLLYLGGIDPIPVTFGDYKSDSDEGRVDWRDVDVSGDQFLADQQQMAIWITNTRKAKFPILKRLQKALEGVIEIDFDGGIKYKGNVGPKYDQSTTTRIAEQKGKLPPEMVKEPEVDPRVKQLQGNPTTFWKYVIEGNKDKGIVTSQVANEFEKNILQVLEQFALMYGDKAGRGNVNFRYRRNPNYQGTKFSQVPTTWNKKITGEPEEKSPEFIDWSQATDKELEAIGAKRYKKGGEDILVPPPGGWPQPGQSQEVLPYVQSYTGDYVQGFDNPLVGSANPADLQEEIKRIKKLLL